jgi:hypothetical protein
MHPNRSKRNDRAVLVAIAVLILCSIFILGNKSLSFPLIKSRFTDFNFLKIGVLVSILIICSYFRTILAMVRYRDISATADKTEFSQQTSLSGKWRYRVLLIFLGAIILCSFTLIIWHITIQTAGFFNKIWPEGKGHVATGAALWWLLPFAAGFSIVMLFEINDVDGPIGKKLQRRRSTRKIFRDLQSKPVAFSPAEALLLLHRLSGTTPAENKFRDECDKRGYTSFESIEKLGGKTILGATFKYSVADSKSMDTFLNNNDKSLDRCNPVLLLFNSGAWLLLAAPKKGKCHLFGWENINAGGETIPKYSRKRLRGENISAQIITCQIREQPGIYTWILELDKMLGLSKDSAKEEVRLKPGRILLIRGEPGSGKTTLALQILSENIKEGNNDFLFFSLETNPYEVMSRSQKMFRQFAQEAQFGKGHSKNDPRILGELDLERLIRNVPELKRQTNDKNPASVGNILDNTDKTFNGKFIEGIHGLVTQLLSLLQFNMTAANRVDKIFSKILSFCSG